MPKRKFPRALGRWALDSGGFSELSMYGEWRTTMRQYVNEVRLYAEEIGEPDFVAPMDWMCEPHVLAKTGLTVTDHINKTIASYLSLRDRLGDIVLPVIQGWDEVDYLRCVEKYYRAGVNIGERLAGVGSVCRRQGTDAAAAIFEVLSEVGQRCHGFGVKTKGLAIYQLESADSMAWSARARRAAPLPGHAHKNCANCMDFALRWRAKLLKDV